MPKLKKFKYFFISLVVLILILLASIFSPSVRKLHDYYLANQKISLEEVSSASAMSKGLSGRQELCQNCGMLFSFSQRGNYPFWMKDMLLPIDLVWLDSGQVVGCQSLPLPILGQDLPKYWPTKPINQALELNTGFCAKYGVKVGDRLFPRLD